MIFVNISHDFIHTPYINISAHIFLPNTINTFKYNKNLIFQNITILHRIQIEVTTEHIYNIVI